MAETAGRAVDSPARAILVAVALGLGGPLLAFVLSLPIVFLLQSDVITIEIALVLALVLGQYVAFGGLALASLRIRDLDWAAVRAYLGVRLPSLRTLLAVLAGWLVIFGSILAIGFLVQLLGAETAENTTGELARTSPAIIPPLIVAMFLVVGPSEEILYRGVVQGRLREALGPVPAIVLASAIFALIHWFALTGGASARLVTVAILFVPSLVFGAVYEYTGNLVAAALLHAIHNSVLLAGLWVAIRLGSDPALFAPISLALP